MNKEPKLSIEEMLSRKNKSKGRRATRVVWLDSKITDYTSEKSSTMKALQRDGKAIDKLSELLATETELLKTIATLKEQVIQFTGTDASYAQLALERAQDELEEVREKARMNYFDKL